MIGTCSKLSGLSCFCADMPLFSFLEEKDKDRVSSLSIALNIVLLEFRSSQFGDLPVPSEQAGRDELIFVSDDQMLVESNRIQEHMSKSKRKPDIVATFTSTLQSVCDNHKSLRYEEWVRLNAEHDIASISSRKLLWPDVHQTWELNQPTKDVSGLQCDEQRHAEQSYSSKKSVNSSSSQRKNCLKRPSDEEQPVRNKRPRVCQQLVTDRSGSPLETERSTLRIVDHERNLLPELRCAYYAAERFQAGWYISHCTAVLLQGVPSVFRFLSILISLP